MDENNIVLYNQIFENLITPLPDEKLGVCYNDQFMKMFTTYCLNVSG